MKYALRLGLALTLTSAAASASPVPLPTVVGGAYSVPVRSFTESRFHNIVRQQYDFSCGSAAVATLLTYHYGQPVTEQEVFSAMIEHGDRERIQRDGFSMLDMQRYLRTRGMHADGFRISLNQLRQLGLPAIALTNAGGYMHFVVVKGVTWDHVLVGDPALGMQKMPRAQFEAGWNGAFFLIRNDVETATRHFNLASEWAVRQQAPIYDAVNRSGAPSYRLSVAAGSKL